MGQAWQSSRINCPHCNSKRLSLREPRLITCHDCKRCFSRWSNEKAVRNWQIVEQYTKDLLDTVAIAELHGLSHGTVYVILKNYQIPMRPRRKYSDADREKSLATRNNRPGGSVAAGKVHMA